MKRIYSYFVVVLLTVLVTLNVQSIFFGDNIKTLLKLNNIINMIEEDYYFEIDSEQMDDYAASGLFLITNDKYSNYYPKDYFLNYTEHSENSFIGIGVSLGVTDDSKNIVVEHVMSNSPAEKSGIIQGDIILEINGKKIFPDDLKNIRLIIGENKNDIDKLIYITYKRNDEINEISLKRDRIVKDTVISEILSDRIGYIKISSFDRKDENDEDSIDSSVEFSEEINKLQNESIDNFIIDLRNNPGGDYEVVKKIADDLLPKCLIASVEDSKGHKTNIYSDNKCINAENIVLLVNEMSASASELLTAALKDNSAAIVVGKKTFGKGILQTVYSFPDGSGATLTTGQYFSPNGNQIHQIGILPDYEVDNNDTDDLQLKKAIEIINTKRGN